MPYERIHIDGAKLAIVRTDSFDSACEPGTIVEVLTSDEWLNVLPDYLETYKHQGRDSAAQTLKYSDTNTVSHVHFALTSKRSSLICKHSRAKGLRQRLRSVLLGSRERTQFHMAKRVLALGVPTATPVALIELSGAAREGLLLMEHVSRMHDLGWVCMRLLSKFAATDRHRLKRAIIDGIIKMFESFRGGGLFHRDMKASNIIVFGSLEERLSLRVGLLDLEGLHKWSGHSLSRWRNALIRLAASLEEYEVVTRTDYLRFLFSYLSATGQHDVDWKSTFRALNAAAREYSRKSKKRKGDKLEGYG